jgi:hypothetical protein
LVVPFAIVLDDAVRFCQFLLREALHANQLAAALAISTRPLLDVFIKLPPSPNVEVTYAEITRCETRRVVLSVGSNS